MHEPLLASAHLVDDDVDRLLCVRERALEHVVVVRREHELAADRVPLLPQDPGQLGEEGMQLVRPVVPAEDRVQLVDEGTRAADQVDPLRDTEQIAVGLRVPVGLREIGRELGPARQVQVVVDLPVRVRRTLTQIRACAEERDHRAGPETSRDDLAMPVERVDCGQVAPGCN